MPIGLKQHRAIVHEFERRAADLEHKLRLAEAERDHFKSMYESASRMAESTRATNDLAMAAARKALDERDELRRKIVGARMSLDGTEES